MKIGTLIIDVYGELLFKQSVEVFISAMYQTLVTVSDKFDSDYKRFGYFAAQIKFTVPLNIFWKNDTIYKTLITQLNKNFNNWKLEINLNIHEEGV